MPAPEITDDMTEEETIEVLALTMDEEDEFEHTIRTVIVTQESI